MLKQMKNNEIADSDRSNFMNTFQKLNDLSIYIEKKLGREC